MIHLDASDVEELGLGGTRTAMSDETSIYDNIVLGQARIMMGNVGVENWQGAAGHMETTQ